MKDSYYEPLISVVVPCFNSGKTLMRCIDSIKRQTWNNKEIIVVNDGSNEEGTLKVLNSLLDIKVFNQKNFGLPVARNNGGKRASGEYLFFLDADDWIDENALKLMYTKLFNHKNNSFIFTDIMLEGKKNKVVCKQYNFFEQLFLNQLPYSILISKHIWIKVGGYDENMQLGYEDWELNIRLGANKIFGKRLPKPLFHYNVSDSGMLISKSSKLHSEIWNYIKNKHTNLFSLKKILKNWWLWRRQLSSYPLIIYFPWYFVINYLPKDIASNIFIFLRNIKWKFVR